MISKRKDKQLHLFCTILNLLFYWKLLSYSYVWSNPTLSWQNPRAMMVTFEWVSEWVSDCVSKCVSWVVSKWVSDWLIDWLSEWASEWMSEWVSRVEVEVGKNEVGENLLD